MGRACTDSCRSMQVITQDHQSQTRLGSIAPGVSLRQAPVIPTSLQVLHSCVVIYPKAVVRFSNLREESQSHTRKSQFRRNSKGPGQLEDVPFLWKYLILIVFAPERDLRMTWLMFRQYFSPLCNDPDNQLSSLFTHFQWLVAHYPKPVIHKWTSSRKHDKNLCLEFLRSFSKSAMNFL